MFLWRTGFGELLEPDSCRIVGGIGSGDVLQGMEDFSHPVFFEEFFASRVIWPLAIRRL